MEINYVEGMETKSFHCPNPKCKILHKYSEYSPRLVHQSGDETELKCAKQFGPDPKWSQDPETETPDQIKEIGSLLLPGVQEPVRLNPGRNIIGRMASTSKATIQANDPTRTMSRCHYYIDVIVLNGIVRHLLSVDPAAPNATMLNGIQLKKTDKFVLHHGDRIRSGQVEIEFKLKSS